MVTIFFDGLCEPNPSGVATFGFVIVGLPGATEPATGCGVVGAGDGMTNNVAEYVALGKALAYLVATKAAVDELSILGDSKLVIEQLKGNWQCNSPRLAELRDRCIGRRRHDRHVRGKGRGGKYCGRPGGNKRFHATHCFVLWPREATANATPHIETHGRTISLNI